MIELKRKFHSFAQTSQFYELCVRAARIGDPALYLAASTISHFRRTEESCTDEEILKAYNDVVQGYMEGDEKAIVREEATVDEKTFLILSFRHAMAWGDDVDRAYRWDLYYEDPPVVFWALYESVCQTEAAKAKRNNRLWAVNGTGLADAVDLGAVDVVRKFVATGFASFPYGQVALRAMLKSSDIWQAFRPLIRGGELSFREEDFDGKTVAAALTGRPVDELRDMVALVDCHSARPGTLFQVAGGRSGILPASVKDPSRLKTLLELGIKPNPPDCLCTDSMEPSALQLAVGEDSVEAVKLLLAYGADPNSGNIYGTACMSALAGRDLTVLKALLAGGAEIDHDCDWKGHHHAPLRVALDHKDYALARKLIELGSVPELVGLCEGFYQPSVELKDLPEDIRALFEEGLKRKVPRGKYCSEGEVRNPYVGQMPESVFWQGEHDGWVAWSDAKVALAWARKAYFSAQARGKLPRWLVDADQCVEEKMLLYWIYVYYCDRHVWPVGLPEKWSARYIIARQHDFWFEEPPCARMIDWTSYWTRVPPKPRLSVVVGDLTKMKVDALVNATGESLLGKGGISAALQKAAGPLLKKACLAVPVDDMGARCPVGEIRVTEAGNLPAKCVIHTVGPKYKDGSWGEPLALGNCYRKSLEYVAANGMRSIAFPCISMGARGYPPDKAVKCAVNTVRSFLKFHNEIGVTFCIYDDGKTASAIKALYDSEIG